MSNEIYEFINVFVLSICVIAFLGLLVCIACSIWSLAGYHLRKLHKEEKIIREYLRDRNDYMYWKNMKQK